MSNATPGDGGGSDSKRKEFEATSGFISEVKRDNPAGVTRTTDSSQPSDLIDTLIGPYRLLESLGEGGMGSVYLAEQREPVERRVALKIIKAGMDTGQVIARFEAERQALAMMDHPNIAKVLDAGATENGRPFFVMEYVPGTPVTTFCDRMKMNVQERLQLFSVICQAVQHAHQKGIIHRDLKPSNILVSLQDDEPTPKVIDFGLAKATHRRLTAKTMHTEQGQVLGTLQYMSPEQTQMNEFDVDTRTDIYSLGVILYELLTGSTPLTTDSLQEAGFMAVIDRIRDEEPVRPSSQISESVDLDSLSTTRRSDPHRLAKQIRGELDWIVMKAMEKDRRRRYDTPSAFASDINRFLNNEPIEARPASLAYRVRKAYQRNKSAYVSVALVALALIVGTVVSIWQAVRATEAKQAAVEAEGVAIANMERAREALDAMSSWVIDDLMVREVDITPEMQGLLERSLELYQDYATERKNDPAARAGVALTNYRVGQILYRLGIDDGGLEAYSTALELYRQLSEEYPEEIDYLEKTFEVHVSLGDRFLREADLDGARREYDRSEEVNARIKERFGDTHIYIENRVAALYSLGLLSEELGEYSEGAQYLEEAIAAQRDLLEDDVEHGRPTFNHRVFLGRLFQQYGLNLRRDGRHADAIRAYEEGIAVLRDVESTDGLNSAGLIRLGVLLNDTGIIHFEEEDYVRAEQFYREAFEVRRQGLARYPNDINHMSVVGASLLNLANLAALQGNIGEALAEYDDAVEILSRVRDRDPTMAWSNGILQSVLRGRVEALIKLERYEQAVDDSALLFEVYRERYPDPSTLPPRMQLRRAYAEVGRGNHFGAIEIVERVLEEAAENGDDRDRAEAAYHAAPVFAALSVDDPEPFRQRALDALREAVESNHVACDVKDVAFYDDSEFAPLFELDEFQELKELSQR